jgi:predicted nucleic acid-binding protein
MTKSSQGVLIADTSGLVSLFIPNDQNHQVAVEAAEKLRNEAKDILIPSAIFVEFLNILGRKASHSAALAAASELTSPFLILSEPQDNTHALKKFAKLPESVSFTDCLVMAAADEYYTPDIFGFDKQKEIIKIISSTDEKLQAYADQQYGLVHDHFKRLLQERYRHGRTDVRVIYSIGEQVEEITSADDLQKLGAEAPFALRKVAWFRPISLIPRCAH